ncbi:type II secretion system F family protein [Halobacteriaceae archaeon GCM10025711]
MLVYLPLLLTLGLLAAFAVAPVYPPVGQVVDRVAITLFGRYINQQEHHRPARRHALRAAHFGVSYRRYAATTLLTAGVVAVAVSVLTVYAVAGALVLLATPVVLATLPEQVQGVVTQFALTNLGTGELFVLLLLSNATVGVAAGLGAYQLRWWVPRYVAGERRRRIEESLGRTVGFVYALSRSGMAFPEVLRSLTRNRGVYGEAAREFEVAVREIDHLGTDLQTALKRLSRRTPSEEFEEFTENLVSVLQGGRNLPRFLETKYEYYKEEAEAQQDQFLELLSTIAEVYVTVFVAGPLFLITILVVFGVVLGGTLDVLRLLTYVVLPLATVGFVVYLDSVTEAVTLAPEAREAATERGHIPGVRPADADDVAGRTDGGTADRRANADRLALHGRLKQVRHHLRNPLRSVLSQPLTLLSVTVPVATLWLGVRLWNLTSAGSLGVSTADDPVVQAALFTLGTFSVVRWVHRRRIEAIDAAVPDFLDRLASVNEAGMPIVESIGRVTKTDLGALDDEIARTWADIQWGARVEHALFRLEARVRTVTVTRVVTLLTNAMTASGDLAPVIRIAADEAQATRRLKRERKQELFTYLVVIYLSFFVFIAIIVVLSVVFLPAVHTPGVGEAGGSADLQTVASYGAIDVDPYRVVFFHTAMVQGVLSGFVAGQMGEGSLQDGAKHATIMLLVAYAVSLVL